MRKTSGRGQQNSPPSEYISVIKSKIVFESPQYCVLLSNKLHIVEVDTESLL